MLVSSSFSRLEESAFPAVTFPAVTHLAPPTAGSRPSAAQVDLLVVGASFAGLACARAAALAGLSVMVLEKKSSAGAKLHTTGIIVKDAVDTVPWLAEVPAALVRRIDGVRLYSPDMRHVDLHAPGYWFWATDAPALLDWMVDSARASGVDVQLGTLFEQALWINGRWEIPLVHGPCHGTCISARYIVGADGPHSRVAKALGYRAHALSLRSRARIPGCAHGARLSALLRRSPPGAGLHRMALDGVGVSQIGLARRMGAQDAPALRLDPLLRKIASVVSPGDAAPVAVRAGMIPCGGVLPVVARERALLVGDAAGMVSPVTAGGIHTALQHGERAGDAIARFVRGEVEDPAGWFVRTYPRFRLKRALRWAFDHFQNDWMFNRLLGTPQMRRMAELVYFHRKASPLSGG
jgi:digeranylgeranylglycerophospholipid reductase